MADISKISRLVNGIVKNVDISQNSLVAGSIKIGTSSPIELTKELVQFIVDSQSLATDTKEKSGFVNNNAIAITYNPTSREVLVPAGSSYYLANKKFTLASNLSLAHADVTGNYFFTINAAGELVASTSAWNYTDVMVAYVMYNTALDPKGIAIYECHGLMDALAHQQFHQTIGTYKLSGGVESAIVEAPVTPEDSDNRPSFESAAIKDEDITRDTAAVSGNYRVLQKTGAQAWSWSAAKPDIFFFGDDYIQYNDPDTNTLEEAASGEFVNYYAAMTTAINGAFSVIFIPGQKAHATLSDAESENIGELNLTGLPFAEFVFVKKFIFKADSAYTTVGKVRVEKSLDIIGTRVSSVNVSGSTSPTNHSNLTNRGDASSHPATAISVSATPANYSAASANVEAHLAGIDTKLADGDGKVKVTEDDTGSSYLDDAIVAGAGLAKAVNNPAGNETLELSVNVDNSSIEINSDTLRVKAAGITDAMLAGSIAYSKLSLSDSIANADINSAAAIAKSKLALTDAIVNADINSAAAIAESKLALDFSTSSLNTAINGKVSKAGDTLTGPLAMSDNLITGLGAPINNNDAARKIYVDDGLSAKVAKAGDVMSGNLSMNGTYRVIGLATPTDADHAANKGYVDNAINGLKWKDAVRVARSTNINLLGSVELEDVVVDGITLVSGDRVLLFGQSDPEWNGIYVFTITGDDYALTRAADANESSEVSQMSVFVKQGTNYADTGWVCTTDGSITLNTTALSFVQFTGAGQLAAGVGLSLSGNTFSVKLGAGISELPTDEVGIDIRANSGLWLTEDGVDASTDGDAQLAIKLDSSPGLSLGAGGIKVADITSSHISASANIALSQTALTAGNGIAFSTNSIAVKLATSSGLEFNEGNLRAKVTGAIEIDGNNNLAIAASSITNTMLAGSIADSKLSTILTANKVAGSAIQLATDSGLADSTGLKINLDASPGLVLGAGGLKVDGITSSHISASANIALSQTALTAGNGIAFSTNSIAVKLATSSGLEFNEGDLRAKVTGAIVIDGSNNLAIAALGITDAMLAGSISDSKLSTISTLGKVAGSAIQLATNSGLEDITGLKIKLDTDSGLSLGAGGLKVQSGNFIVFTGVHSTIAEGDIVAIHADGYIKPANASSLADCESVIGIADAGASAGASSTIKVQIAGRRAIKNAAFTGNLGKSIFVSTTAGEATATAPEAANSVIFKIGYAVSATEVVLQPQFIAHNANE